VLQIGIFAQASDAPRPSNRGRSERWVKRFGFGRLKDQESTPFIERLQNISGRPTLRLPAGHLFSACKNR